MSTKPDQAQERGTDLYREACRRDLEGIVAKWSRGTYQTDGRGTSWLKIKNPDYTQMAGGHELFEARRDQRGSRRSAALDLPLA